MSEGGRDHDGGRGRHDGGGATATTGEGAATSSGGAATTGGATTMAGGVVANTRVGVSKEGGAGGHGGNRCDCDGGWADRSRLSRSACRECPNFQHYELGTSDFSCRFCLER